MKDIETLSIEGMVVKINRPDFAGIPPVTLMLHGWTGDEDSMWVFTRNLPVNHQIITVRGLYPSNHPEYGGYSWTEQHDSKWPNIKDFGNAVDRLKSLLSTLSQQVEADFTKINLVGFSQGAALSYVYALSYPLQVKRVAGLAGFFPPGSEAIIEGRPLNGIPVYMAHGDEDETVPIEMAYEAERILTEAGAHVSLCKSDIGHRLGANCFEAFKKFMAASV